MKYLNAGALALIDMSDRATQFVKQDEKSRTGMYFGRGANDRQYWRVNLSGQQEVWVSFDVYVEGYGMDGWGYTYMKFGDNLPFLRAPAGNPFVWSVCTQNGSNVEVLYTIDKTMDIKGSIHNIEIHYKTGENGRIDMWLDTKLFMSFRSPSAFAGNIGYFRYETTGNYPQGGYFSSIIIQDTRRIGLERFKMLTIDPATEQNMPQGSTTTYRLSGLSDSTEFADITSVGAILQATSRDANITEGTFSIEGATLGTIDVSDSSGGAFEIAHAETNSLTGKPWTRDDIEGKTLSFTVNGAS